MSVRKFLCKSFLQKVNPVSFFARIVFSGGVAKARLDDGSATECAARKGVIKRGPSVWMAYAVPAEATVWSITLKTSMITMGAGTPAKQATRWMAACSGRAGAGQ
jgi:hypothetical protein